MTALIHVQPVILCGGSGTPEIANSDKGILLTDNYSTYIPLVGRGHRLANPSTISLEIIKVQSGSYPGENDIARFGDHDGRQI